MWENLKGEVTKCNKTIAENKLKLEHAEKLLKEL